MLFLLFLTALGFSIKGGRDNVFLEGSNGIYVYRLYDDGLAMQSRGVDIGDQLLEVRPLYTLFIRGLR